MSIRLRLALWYGGLAGLVVFLVSLLTYIIHSRAHYDEMDRLLANALNHLTVEPTPGSSPKDMDGMLAVPLAPDLVVRLYGPADEILAASLNTDAAPSINPRAVVADPTGPPFDPVVGLAPPLISVESGRGIFSVLQTANGTRWRVHVRAVPDAATDPDPYFVALSPLDRIDHSVERFRQLATIFAGTGIAITFGIAWLLASHALRPVATMTDTAHAIAHSRDFRHRVPIETHHDELGRLAATFNDMLASLEQAYRSQQRFVSDASHELRAPLTAIQANLELIAQRPTMSVAERQEAVGEANREAGRLARLVADLLVLARADAGVPLRHQHVELDRILLDVLGQARHLASGQRIGVAKLEPALVDGDPDRLKQLLLILLDNAVRYTPPAGQIAVELRRNGTAAEVVVRDTGVGIAPEDLRHVFDRFYRADPARARDPGGTGLGLSIAQSIARQHGGDVSLTSEIGRGTTAMVQLPVLG